MKIPKNRLRKLTKRLEIRPLEPRDFEVWREAYTEMREVQNEWDETNWNDKFLTPSEFRKLLAFQKEQRSSDRNYFFAIFRRDDGRLIGLVSLMDLSRQIFQNAYVGYRIFNSYWRYGYGSEAVAAALDLGFRQLRLHRIEAGISPRNRASLGLARTVGLRYEGLSRRRLFAQGEWRDMQLYAATSEDFKIKYRFPK